jgi:cephalosporin hydroxylase
LTRAARISAVHVAVATLRAELEVYESLLSPGDYAVVADLLGRVLDAERRHVARWKRRKHC